MKAERSKAVPGGSSGGGDEAIDFHHRRSIGDYRYSSDGKARRNAEEICSGKKGFGSVYVTHASYFAKRDDPAKTRRVVDLGKRKNGKVLVAPVLKPGLSMPVSGFDGNRMVDIEKAKYVIPDELYYKNLFRGVGNDKLTSAEKYRLKRIMRKYAKAIGQK